jgi:formate/nitrite transporter FocA (FNT family)
MSDGAVGEVMVQIARNKITLDPVSAVARGILCNVLVCLALWLCMGARSVSDKIFATLFPITAFIACGFEHSVANMYFLPIGWYGLQRPLMDRSRHLGLFAYVVGKFRFI